MKRIFLAILVGLHGWHPGVCWADNAPVSRPQPIDLNHAALVAVPFQKLIRQAAGIEIKRPEAPKVVAKAGVKPPPELQAAYQTYVQAERAFDAQSAVFERQSAYIQNSVQSMPWAFPEVQLNNQVVGRNLPEAKPVDNAVIIRHEMAWKAYVQAYRKYGDPSGTLPNPTESIAEDRPAEHNLSPARIAGVTPNNRVIAITSGGKDLKTGRRLWLADQTKAIVVLEEGVEIKRDGNVMGKLGRFEALTGNSRGDVMILGWLISAAKPVYERNASIFIWNHQSGLRFVAAPSEPLPALGDGWVVESYLKGSMDADGNVALECRAIRMADSKRQEPVVLISSGGRLRNGAFKGESRAVQEEIPQKPKKESKPPRKQPRAERPQEPRYRNRTVTVYQFGDESVTLRDDESVGLANGKWIPGGHYAFFGRLGLGNSWTGYVYSVGAATGQFKRFESAGAESTWFAPDGGVAIVDTVDPSGRQRPSSLRFGPPNAAKSVADFPAQGVFGLGGEQSLRGSDDNGRRLIVALGGGSQIAFTGYVSGRRGTGRFDPDLGRSVGAPGVFADTWQLFAGNSNTGDLEVVTSEFGFTKDSGEAGANRLVALGRCTQLQFTQDGTLLLTTDGLRTARIDRGERIPSSESIGGGRGRGEANYQNFQAYPTSKYAWAWDRKRGLRLLASAEDKVSVEESNSELGHFECGLGADGRLIITRRANDCVFFTAAR